MAQDMEDSVNPSYFSKGTGDETQEEQQTNDFIPIDNGVIKDPAARQDLTVKQNYFAPQNVSVKQDYRKSTPQPNDKRGRESGRRKRKAKKSTPQAAWWPEVQDEKISRRDLIVFAVALAVLAVLFILMVLIPMPAVARIALTVLGTALGLGWLFYVALKK